MTYAAVAAKISIFLALVKIARLAEKRPENAVMTPSRMIMLLIR